jgi:ClpP class serine protease
MNLKNRINNELANYRFFRIDNFVMEYYKEFEKEIETNKPIHLKPTNWEEHKETFYNQQIDTYKDKGYNTKEKKINSEIRKIESLPIENEKYILLKEHYRDFLNEKLKSKEDNPEQTKKQIEFEDFFKNITAKQIKNIKDDFKDLEPKETAIFIDLLYNDFQVLNIIYGSRKGKSQKDFIKHITDNSNQSINKLFSKDTKKNYTYKGSEADKTTIKTQLETILK